jgi:nitrogen-specific signal transduction histidine kinase/CheY-like chemotaxis protein
VEGLDYVLVVIRDLTERRRADRAEAQAVAGGRLASMGRLAAGVAHEINNPLAYVIGHLETIRSAMLDDALRVRVDEALDGAARVRAIVDDLRSLSRGDDERRAPVDLVRVIDAACNIAEVHVRHRSRLVRDIGPAPRVFGNESRLGQLVLNLLLNAVEAIPEGRAAENEIRLSLGTDSSGRVVLAVSDTGVGVEESAIPQLFDPFFTTKPVGVGTGLGLSICHGIVNALGGEIAVESVVGKGSTFRVTLPASNQVEAPAASAPATCASRSRVLIIDDEPRVARALADLLGTKHDVDVEVSASRALERFIQGERFDVICCDLMMPNMTGMELQDALDERVPELARRTLYMTGGAFTPRAREFLHRIGNRALEKPFSVADVERAIARIRALTS